MQKQASFQCLPSSFVGREITNNRITRYVTSKQPLLSSNIGKPETKAIWYSLRQIEEIYNELVYLNADGLRLYFGAYEEDHPDFANQLCILMVPTRLNGETLKHTDIILEEEEGFNKRLEITSKYPKDFNYGSPCPPVCSDQDLNYPE